LFDANAHIDLLEEENNICSLKITAEAVLTK
jgi:hypothetical protein